MPTSISDSKPLLLVLGAGYSAGRFVELHGGMFDRVVATSRRPEKIEALKAFSVPALPFDTKASTELREVAAAASHVLVSIPPGPAGDPALAELGGIFAASPALRWIGYLSTTGVYGDHGGAWIDETTPVTPQSPRSTYRAEAERGWLALAREGLSVQVFRLSGIYGPRRNPLTELKNGTARRLDKPGQIFNRIHVDDIAGAVAAGLARPDAGPVFNLSDNEPAPNPDVTAFAAGLMGIEPPPLTPFDAAEMSDMARSFWDENKRVSSKLAQSELGFDLTYPTYREGLRALYESGEGR